MLFLEWDKEKLSTKDSDIGFQEYKNFLQNVVFVRNEFKSYDRTGSRFDKFFFEITSFKKHQILEKVINMILCLNHDQADIERRFSINKNLLKVIKICQVKWNLLWWVFKQSEGKEKFKWKGKAIKSHNNRHCDHQKWEVFCDTLTKDFEKLMDKAEKKYDMTLEANSLKRKRIGKCKEICEMQTMLETLERRKCSSIFYLV